MVYFSNLVRDLKRKFCAFMEEVTDGLKRSDRKFAYDMVWGMLASDSCMVSSIARKLFEDDIRVTENRLTLNLKTADLSALNGAFIDYVVKNMMSLDARVIGDESDVIKQFGKAFEGIGVVRDGSREGKPKGKGWPVTCLITLTEGRFVIPLVLRLYSTSAKGYKSVFRQTESALKLVLGKMEGRDPISSLDRGYDGENYINFFFDSARLFIIRAKSNRVYETSRGRGNIASLASALKGRYVFDFYSKSEEERRVRATAIRASHKGFSGDVWLVFEFFEGESEPRVYITNMDCSTKEGVRKALSAYRLRWRIEEFFRFIKVVLGFEKFRIREMKAMNNLFLMLSIAVALLTEIIQEGGALWDGVLAAYQPLTDLKEEARIKKEYGYSGLMLYRAAEGVKTILGRAAQRPEVPGRDQRKRYKQLTLF